MASESLEQPDKPDYQNQVVLGLEILKAHGAVCSLQDIHPLVDVRNYHSGNTDTTRCRAARPIRSHCCGHSKFLIMCNKYSRL